MALDSHQTSMQFLAINECWDWCEDHGVSLDDRRLPAPDPGLLHQARLVYVQEPGHSTAVRPEILAATLDALGEWTECLVWVTLWGVWPSTEDWPRYYGLRGDLGERRSLEAAPGHLAAPTDRPLLTTLQNLVMAHGWDAHVLAARDGVVEARAFISHDEWVALAGRSPFVPSAPVIQQLRCS